MTNPSALRPQFPEIPLPHGEAFQLPGRSRPERPAWWKFFGPAFIVSIGYFDPGNWATNLKAGSQFGYTLLWVLTLSCLIGAVVQNLCSKLGIA
ncbi:MAG: Nramp family divalent metal transporter, partial [Proteobacteria bacterium]|nr:Nramp family divalent metal transporter [Pseudomonadota bacterium]